MKKKCLFGLLLAFALALLSCDKGVGYTDDPVVTPETITYVSTGEGVTYTLKITQKLNKAAYTPVTGDSYVLSIERDGTTKTSSGTVTVSSSGSNRVFSLSNGTNARITVNSSGGMVRIEGTINTNDGTVQGSGDISPQSNSLGSGSVAVTGVSLNKSSTSILVDASETLTATIAPENATNKNVTWSSSDTSVATVSSSGVVSAVDTGTATITVTTSDGGRTAACTVTVTDTPLIEIIEHPAAITRAVGNTGGSLSVFADVSGDATLSYQWYSNTSGSNTGGTAISGATSSSHTIAGSLAKGVHYYFVEVRASGGAESVRSNAATVTVTDFVVNFNTLGGTAIPSQYVNTGEKLTSVSNPSRTGYDFKGWWTDKGFVGKQFDFDTEVEANMTLFANWKYKSPIDGVEIFEVWLSRTPEDWKREKGFTGWTFDDLDELKSNEIPVDEPMIFWIRAQDPQKKMVPIFARGYIDVYSGGQRISSDDAELIVWNNEGSGLVPFNLFTSVDPNDGGMHTASGELDRMPDVPPSPSPLLRSNWFVFIPKEPGEYELTFEIWDVKEKGGWRTTTGARLIDYVTRTVVVVESVDSE